MEQLDVIPLGVWRAWDADLRGQPIDSGQHVAKDEPDDLTGALLTPLAPQHQMDR